MKADEVTQLGESLFFAAAGGADAGEGGAGGGVAVGAGLGDGTVVAGDLDRGREDDAGDHEATCSGSTALRRKYGATISKGSHPIAAQYRSIVSSWAARPGTLPCSYRDTHPWSVPICPATLTCVSPASFRLTANRWPLIDAGEGGGLRCAALRFTTTSMRDFPMHVKHDLMQGLNTQVPLRWDGEPAGEYARYAYVCPGSWLYKSERQTAS